MAKLSPSDFADKWIPLLADNVFMDIDGPRLERLITDITDSFAPSSTTANVPDWVDGTYYSQGFVILHSFLGSTAIFLKAKQAGYLEEPTDPEGDDNWEPVLSPAPDNALYQVGTVSALRLARGSWVPNRLYWLIGRQDGLGQPLDDVFVRAVAPGQLEPEGFTLDNSSLAAAPVAVRYELASDTTAPVNGMLYNATGQHTDGAMTQKATSDALAGKLDLANAWPDLSTENQIYALFPNNTIAAGAASVFNGDVRRELPPGNDPFTGVSGLMYWRALAPTIVTFSRGTVDGAASLTLAAGEWVFLLGLGGRNSAECTWYVRMRGNVSGASPGAGGASGTVKTVNGMAPDAAGDVTLASTDRYEVPQAVRDAVLAGTFGSGELQGAQPAGSLAGQRFTTASYGFEYERGAGGGLVWCRYAKG
jgi:hypothetical protein